VGGLLPQNKYTLAGTGVLNILLRFVTNQPVTL